MLWTSSPATTFSSQFSHRTCWNLPPHLGHVETCFYLQKCVILPKTGVKGEIWSNLALSTLPVQFTTPHRSFCPTGHGTPSKPTLSHISFFVLDSQQHYHDHYHYHDRPHHQLLGRPHPQHDLHPHLRDFDDKITFSVRTKQSNEVEHRVRKGLQNLNFTF